MTNTTLQTTAQSLLTKKELELLNKKEIESIRESLITLYVDECYNYVKSNEGKFNQLVSKFSKDLLESIKDDNKLTKSVFDIFNKSMKKVHPKFLVKLRLLDYDLVSKFSNLKPKYIKDINFEDDIQTIKETIKSNYKLQLSESADNSAINRINKKEELKRKILGN